MIKTNIRAGNNKITIISIGNDSINVTMKDFLKIRKLYNNGYSVKQLQKSFKDLPIVKKVFKKIVKNYMWILEHKTPLSRKEVQFFTKYLKKDLLFIWGGIKIKRKICKHGLPE